MTKQKPEYWIATTVKYGVTTFCTTSRQFGMANINIVSEKAKRKKKPLPGKVSYCPVLAHGMSIQLFMIQNVRK